MYPVDLLKVCTTPQNYTAQAMTDIFAPLQTRMQVINPASGGLYTGLTNAVSTISRMEGIRTLWRGVSSVIIGAGMPSESPHLCAWQQADIHQVRRMLSTSVPTN